MLNGLNELREALIAESAHAAPAHILEGLPSQLAHQNVPGAPHTIYDELWHIAFWQQMSLNWINGTETPYPARPEHGFPSPQQKDLESWEDLCQRFRQDSARAAAIASDATRLSGIARCPSRPGQPIRLMTAEEQLISLAAHNAYHFGRIVLLRQLLAAWPPPSGGFGW